MRKAILIGALLLLAGCVNQSEMQLSSDVVQIDVDARGLIGIQAAREGMAKRISQTVIQRGYTHYKVISYGSQSGSVYAGTMPMTAQTTFNTVGSTTYGTTQFSGGQQLRAPVSSSSIVVKMYREPNVPADAIRAQ